MNKIKKNFFNKILDIITFSLLHIIFLISKIIPMCILATIFGFLGVLFCLFIPANKIVIKNLRARMPMLSFWERTKLMFSIWYNLGRFLGEYPYIYFFKKNGIFKYVDIDDKSKKILYEIKNNKNGCIIFSGHISNWEFGLRALEDIGLKTSVIFRKSNNNFIEKNYCGGIREKIGIEMIAKGDNAGIKAVKSIKKGNSLVILSDQREKRYGLLIDFFGIPTYTPRSIYVLAKKLNVPVYGIRIIRKGLFSNFELKAEDKFYVDINDKEEEILQKINDTLEKWIKEYPSQWFWIHDRWK